MNRAPAPSREMRISSSRYSTFMAHVGSRPSKGPPFHGSSFHTAFTGYHRSMKMRSTKGMRATPGAVTTRVFCSTCQRRHMNAHASTRKHMAKGYAACRQDRAPDGYGHGHVHGHGHTMRSVPSGSSDKPSARETTRPPKVGNSLNQPTIGITCREEV